MRTQSKTAMSYMFRNFWQIFPFAAIPALLLGLFSNDMAVTNFLADAFTGKIGGDEFVRKLLFAFSVLKLDKNWWLSVVAALLVIGAESFLLVKISRHMGLGINGFSGFWKRGFAVMGGVTLYVLLFVLLNEVFMFVTVGVGYIFGTVTTNVIALSAITLVVYVILNALFAVLFGMFLCALPAAIYDDYTLNVAMSYSVRLTSAKGRGIIGRFLLTYIVARLVSSLLGWVFASFGAEAVIYSLYYLWWLCYLPCSAFASYFYCIGAERKDIGRVMFDRV